MGFIIVTRNPRNKKLVIVTGEDDETVAEFETEGEARAVAMAVPVCEAWGYEAVEISY